MKNHMKTKHSPGPWTVHHSGLVLADGGATSIAYAGPDRAQVFRRASEDATMANALLIAAAPDLLEALKSAARAIYAGEDEPGAYAKVLAAIAKAEG